MNGSTDHTTKEWVNFVHHAPTLHEIKVPTLQIEISLWLYVSACNGCLRTSVARGEHVYHDQLVSRLLRHGLKIGTMVQHDISHTTTSIMPNNFVLGHAFGMVDGQKHGF